MTDVQWVRIERSFDASIETVWRMWTEAALFEQWYGPNGMSTSVEQMDVTVGGIRKFCMKMQTPDRDMTMWFVGQYEEITPPSKLVYTESMSDENGNILSPASMGMPEGHPEVTKVVVELKETDGKTKMTMTHIGVPADSGGAGGWAQAMDKFAERLQTLSN